MSQGHPPPGYAGQVEPSYRPSHPLVPCFPYKESQSSRGRDMILILHFHHHIEETAYQRQLKHNTNHQEYLKHCYHYSRQDVRMSVC